MIDYTFKPLYNMVHYSTVSDIAQFKDGHSYVSTKQKYIDYTRK